MVRKQLQAPPTDYNIKVGQVLLTADVNVATEYIDNVYLTHSAVESDFVVRPEFGLNIAWQATQLNVLQLHTSVSYTKYFSHSDLDSQNLTLAPNSALTFSVFVGDVKVQFHDAFSLQNDTVSNGSLSGVSKLPRFTNTVGVTLLWDLNDLVWSLGYDHYNFLTVGSAVTSQGTTDQDFSQLNHSIDQISTSVSAQLNSSTQLGLEASAGYSEYPNNSASNFTSYSVGPTLDFQFTKFTAVSMNGGFKGYSFSAGPPSLQVNSSGALVVVPGREAGLSSGYYGGLTLMHRLNQHYSDRLELGHEDEADPISGRVESNYIRYSANWICNTNWAFTLGLFAEQGRVATGNGVSGALTGDYTRWGGRISTGYKVTKYVNLALAYELTKKDADDASQSYTQNTVSLTLGYNF